MQLVEQGKINRDRDINRHLDFTIPAALGKQGDDASSADTHGRF